MTSPSKSLRVASGVVAGGLVFSLFEFLDFSHFWQTVLVVIKQLAPVVGQSTQELSSASPFVWWGPSSII